MIISTVFILKVYIYINSQIDIKSSGLSKQKKRNERKEWSRKRPLELTTQCSLITFSDEPVDSADAVVSRGAFRDTDTG